MTDSFLNGAIVAAQTAGKKQQEAFGGTLVVDEMSAHDIKLKIDRDCQDIISKILLEKFPDHTVFGEEGGSPYGASDYQWIVDPIDGTVNFFYNFPHFCVSIALQHQQRTILGVIYDPIRHELFTAAKGIPAKLNGRKIFVSKRDQLKDAMVSTGFAKSKHIVNESMERVKFLALNVRKIRMNGCAALDMAYIACGRLDAYLEQGIRLWDIAAGQLLIESAGGQVMLEQLESPPHSYRMIASNGKLEFPFLINQRESN